MTIAPSGTAVGSGNGPSVPEFADAFVRHLTLDRGVGPADASREDRYRALAATVRDVLVARRLRDAPPHGKTVCYLSAEYLLGRQLDNALQATGLSTVAVQALASCGVDLDDLRAVEPEPGLGNGGLGRLAACFADSLATAGMPSVGYGIRYDYGLFRQTFVEGRQVERPDAWLTAGTPWELQRPEQAVTVSFGGRTEAVDDAGVTRTRWIPDVHVRAVPCDYLVPGYRGGRTNVLRLWTAAAVEPFDLDAFTAGRYADAVRAQTFAQTITRVLYPEDSTPEGKALRLRQQYFFAAAAVRDAVDGALADGADPERLPERLVFQLNDTHPVIAVPELMRILVDDEHQDWDAAWSITRRCFAYTCHTLLPEALEEWPERLVDGLLPRHGEIIRRIDDGFRREVRARLGDEHARRMAIVTEHHTVRMAHLAVVAATAVNGVARLHSTLLRERVLPDFDAFFPGRFTNVTNGVSPRRFLLLANPGLSALITDAIGPGWETDLDRLRELEPAADDTEFRCRFRAVKADNKRRLAAVLCARDGIRLDTGHLLDVMVKRVHEYKRQMLKLLHVVSVLEGVRAGRLDATGLLPRTVVFGGKAAPGYVMAKRTIHLINAVAVAVDAEPLLAGRLRVLYPQNYDVSLAEAVIPAADVSEQISLAGLEASGTGNMKLALNGALTVGTDDGANAEIRELVGDDNFFLFGMSEPEAHARREAGYRPGDVYDADPVLRAALDLIASGTFSDGDRGVFEPIVSELLHGDRFMVLADFAAYARCQDRVDAAYADADAWARAAIVNVARCGRFSSDRSIRDYATGVWHVAATPGR